MLQTISRAGDSVNGLMWRALGRSDDETEAALFALNPGLAGRGPVLPAGVVVNLPEVVVKRAEIEVQSPWD